MVKIIGNRNLESGLIILVFVLSIISVDYNNLLSYIKYNGFRFHVVVPEIIHPLLLFLIIIFTLKRTKIGWIAFVFYLAFLSLLLLLFGLINQFLFVYVIRIFINIGVLIYFLSNNILLLYRINNQIRVITLISSFVISILIWYFVIF
jgi:hypothetical protein